MYANARVVKGVVRILQTPRGRYIVKLIKIRNSLALVSIRLRQRFCQEMKINQHARNEKQIRVGPLFAIAAVMFILLTYFCLSKTNFM